MPTATGLVKLAGADDDDGLIIAGRLAIDQTLRARGVTPADHADGVKLVDMLGLGQEMRHRPEGFASKVKIETGHQHAQSPLGQCLRHADNLEIEELGFVDPDHGGRRIQQIPNAGSVFDGRRIELRSSMGGDLALSEAGIETGLEDLNPLPGDSRPAQPPDELVGLPAKHRACDDFDAAEHGTSDVGVESQGAGACAPAPSVPQGRTGGSLRRLGGRRSLQLARHWQIETALAQASLQVDQTLAAEAFDGQEGGVATLEQGQRLADR